MIADWQGRNSIGLLVAGVVLLVAGLLLPNQDGILVGLMLCLSGIATCGIEQQRKEPGIWMVSALLLFVFGLPMFGGFLIGMAGDTARPDAQWQELIEGWLSVLVLLVNNVYLWHRTQENFRLSRSVRQAIRGECA